MRVLFIDVIDSHFTSKLHLNYDSALNSVGDLTIASLASYQSPSDVVELDLYRPINSNLPVSHTVLSGADLIYVFYDKKLYYVSKRIHKIK